MPSYTQEEANELEAIAQHLLAEIEGLDEAAGQDNLDLAISIVDTASIESLKAVVLLLALEEHDVDPEVAFGPVLTYFRTLDSA